jgi:alpha-N-arabinofuranosidase
VNKDPEKEAVCDLGIGGLDGSIIATFLSGDSTEAFNDIDSPNRVVPQEKKIRIRNGMVTIPAHSLVILPIKKK